MQTRNDFNDLLVEYSNLAKGKFAFEFVNPNDDDKVEQEISKYGIARKSSMFVKKIKQSRRKFTFRHW
jgi:hypothetical protein